MTCSHVKYSYIQVIVLSHYLFILVCLPTCQHASEECAISLMYMRYFSVVNRWNKLSQESAWLMSNNCYAFQFVGQHVKDVKLWSKPRTYFFSSGCKHCKSRTFQKQADACFNISYLQCKVKQMSKLYRIIYHMEVKQGSSIIKLPCCFLYFI